MHRCWCKYERSRSRRKEGKEGRKERREGRKRKVLEKLINASLVERVVAKNGRAISTGSRGNFSTNTSRKAHRLGNADNCIPPRSHSWWKSSVHGAMGYGGVGVAFRPRLIQSEEEFTVYLWQARGNRFPAIISPTLRNDRAKPPPPSPPPLYPHVFRLTRATFLSAIRPFFLYHLFSS